MPLTDTQIRKAGPGPKSRRLYDAKGLYLEVSPKGGKWWRLKYRFDGKEKRLSLGVYPDVSLKDARARRDEARQLLANQVDPSEFRKNTKSDRLTKASNSFEAVAREWFAKYSPSWATSHSSRIIRRLERDVFPWIGGHPIADITPAQILDVLRRIEARGALETAHRALQNCGQVFRYAVATGRADRDPSGDLRGALPPYTPVHFPAVTDPAEVGSLLRTLDEYHGSLPVRCALRLAPLVFVRPGELRQAEWAHIDLDSKEWRYTVSKTKTQHIVPLASQSLGIIEEIRPLTGHGRYVFPSARSPRGDRPMSDNALLVAMRSLGISKHRMTGHGFRAIARTLLDEVLGFRPDLIEHQLAHAVRDPNGRAYNRTAHLPERREMMQKWADYLDLLRANGPMQEGVSGDKKFRLLGAESR